MKVIQTFISVSRDFRLPLIFASDSLLISVSSNERFIHGRENTTFMNELSFVNYTSQWQII